MKKEDLRIVFMGTPEFAVPSLKRILESGYKIVGVITAPDRKSGRGKQVNISAVKKFALEKGLRLLQPENLKDETFLQELSALNANLQIVVAFRMLPELVWAMPRFGTFNLHASLLPQYRGAAPINHAIINGEKVTGLTTFFIDATIDTGKIILQEKVKIADNEDAGKLHDRMMQIGADLVEKTIGIISDKKSKPFSQSDLFLKNEKLRPAPKLFKKDCQINWNLQAHQVYNFVRGLCPYPTAFTSFVSPEGEEILVKIFRVSKEIIKHNNVNGHLITDGNSVLKIPVSDGYIHILDLQAASKKRMDVADFLRGTSLKKDWRVG